jgi:hypothetical protein
MPNIMPASRARRPSISGGSSHSGWKLIGFSPAGGLLIVKRKWATPDALYSDLSGREAFRLLNEFATWQRAQKARDSAFQVVAHVTARLARSPWTYFRTGRSS